MEVFMRNRICPNCAEELITNHLEAGDKYFNLVPLLDAKLEKCERSIEEIRELKRDFHASPHSLLYVFKDDYEWNKILENLRYYFTFNAETSDCYLSELNLTDEDYVSIANLKYPHKYDRCVQLRIAVYISANYSFYFECKMVVSKDIILKSETEYYIYSYKEIMEMQENEDIQIVSITDVEEVKKTGDVDEKIKSAILIFLQETFKDMWLGQLENSTNRWFKYWLLFLKQHVTYKLLDSSINAYVQCCNEILRMPDDASIDMAIKSYKNGEKFKGMSEKRRESLRNLIKSRANENGFDKAIEIIIEHSEYYKRIMAYKKT